MLRFGCFLDTNNQFFSFREKNSIFRFVSVNSAIASIGPVGPKSQFFLMPHEIFLHHGVSSIETVAGMA